MLTIILYSLKNASPQKQEAARIEVENAEDDQAEWSRMEQQVCLSFDELGMAFLCVSVDDYGATRQNY